MKIAASSTHVQALQRQSPVVSPQSTDPQDSVEIASARPTPEPAHRWRAGLLAAVSLAGASLGLAGCSSGPPQEQQQSLSVRASYAFMSAQDEVALGRQVSARVEAQTPLWRDAEAQARIDRIGQRLAKDSSRKDVTYTFKLLDDRKTINAMAVPGGTIYVTRGLYENYHDDDELTFVLGHEMGHVEQRHSIQQLGKAGAVDLAVRVLLRNQGQAAHAAGQLAEQLLSNQFSQGEESEADQIGQQHLRHLGIDPNKAVSAMERLQVLTGGDGQSEVATRILGDHPPTRDRIEALRKGAQGSPSVQHSAAGSH